MNTLHETGQTPQNPIDIESYLVELRRQVDADIASGQVDDATEMFIEMLVHPEILREMIAHEIVAEQSQKRF